MMGHPQDYEIPPETELAGRYRLHAPLGRGGMAVVYRAIDQALQREVAVKVVSRSLSTDEVVVKRFIREAQRMASLDSPHVVPVYDVGQDGPHVFLVMKLLTGPTLQDILQREGPLRLDRAIKLVGQVLEGLAHLHDRGLVHRDIKPSNVIVTEGEQAVLLDLGIARTSASAPKSSDPFSAPIARGTTTEDKMLMGTPEYMSPERVLDKSVDARSDLYAVGIVLYELLTDRVPFEGPNAIEVCLRHLNEKPPSPRTFAPDLPESAARVILRALEKDPGKRYQSALELRDALVAVIREPVRLALPSASEAGIDLQNMPGEEVTLRARARSIEGMPGREPTVVMEGSEGGMLPPGVIPAGLLPAGPGRVSGETGVPPRSPDRSGPMVAGSSGTPSHTIFIPEREERWSPPRDPRRRGVVLAAVGGAGVAVLLLLARPWGGGGEPPVAAPVRDGGTVAVVPALPDERAPGSPGSGIAETGTQPTVVAAVPTTANATGDPAPQAKPTTPEPAAMPATGSAATPARSERSTGTVTGQPPRPGTEQKSGGTKSTGSSRASGSSSVRPTGTTANTSGTGTGRTAEPTRERVAEPARELEPASSDPSDPVAQARQHLKAGDTASAQRVLDQALIQSPNRADLHRLRGDIFYQVGNSGSALGAYRRYLSLVPEGAAEPYVKRRLKELGGL